LRSHQLQLLTVLTRYFRSLQTTDPPFYPSQLESHPLLVSQMLVLLGMLIPFHALDAHGS
ncbi:hypothetical protein R0K18_31080, partial [Pantoea sp. SIMBA_133]